MKVSELFDRDEHFTNFMDLCKNPDLSVTCKIEKEFFFTIAELNSQTATVHCQLVILTLASRRGRHFPKMD